MIGNIVARRYAKALFTLGAKKGDAELAAFGSDLQNIVAVLEASPDVLKVFKNPVFSAEAKKGVVADLLGKLGVTKSVLNFCLLLADKGRLDQLPSIAQGFGELLDERQGVLRGELVTAIKLPAARQKEIVTQLEKQSGKKLDLSFSVRKGILGGVVLKIGDQVLDASLRAQLDILKENIKRGE